MRRVSPIARAAVAEENSSSVAVVDLAPPAEGKIVQLPVSAPTTTPAKASGLKKISFGAIAKNKTSETKTVYPVLPPTGDSQEIVDRILQRTREIEALEGALETDKAELKVLGTPFYFKVNQGRHEVPSSVSCLGKPGDDKPAEEVLLNFQNRYSMLPDEAGLLPILGERTGEFFRQSFELKIKGDKLPADKTQELMDELQAVFAKYGATDAIEVKEGVKPIAEFHAARHLQLTPEQNLALDAACPIVVMVKTKGRK